MAADIIATPWWTLEQSSTYANVSARTLMREIAAGRLRAARIGGRRSIRLKREYIDAWLEASATPVEVTRG